MIKNLDHVCIVVKDLDATIENFTALLGAEPIVVIKEENPNIKLAHFKLGGSVLEFCEATPGSPFVEFIETHGEGLHHIGYEVSDIAGELAKHAARGVTLQDRQAHQGPGHKYAYVGPEGTNGTLIEFIEPD